jgi:predicted ATPase/transcriptional regulator with XRE-family HTH domain
MGRVTFGSELKRLRAIYKCSQKELANRSGYALPTVQAFEQGARLPSLEAAETLANALKLSAADASWLLSLARQGQAHSRTVIIPSTWTSFVGRTSELSRVAALVKGSKHRLVTLLGMGGTGKTRLATEVLLKTHKGFDDGAALITLTDVHEQSAIAGAILSRLGQRPQGEASPEEQLIAWLAPRQLLLTLDNVEQLLPGVAKLVDTLLDCAPDIRILCTSRQPLMLHYEKRELLDGLAHTSTASDGETEASQLFRERAALVTTPGKWTESDVRAMHKICTLVEGVPLAVELAAALCADMPPTRLLDVIKRDLLSLAVGFVDKPDRHKSLRVMLNESWSRLNDMEQRALRRISVFAGGARLDAARRVCDIDQPVLESLVARSLLTMTDSGRLHVHEMVRQYSADQLDMAGDAGEAVARHVRWVSDFSSELVDTLFSATYAERAGAYARDAANIRAGILRGLEKPELVSDAANALGMLCWFWYSEGEWTFVAERLPQVLSRNDIRWRPRARGFANLMQGMLYYFSSDMRGAIPHLNDSVATFQAADCRDELIIAQGSRVTAAAQAGDFALAQESFRTCLALCEASNSDFARAYGLSTCAFLPMYSGSLDQAISMFTMALRFAQSSDDQWTIALCTLFLSAMHLELGDNDAADSELQILQGAAARTGSHEHTAALHVNRAFAALARQDADAAHAQVQTAQPLFERVNLSRRWATVLIVGAWIRHLRGDDQESALLLARAERVHEQIGGPKLHPDNAFAAELASRLGQPRLDAARQVAATMPELSLNELIGSMNAW